MFAAENEIYGILQKYPATNQYVLERLFHSPLDFELTRGHPLQLSHVLWAIRPLPVKWNAIEELSRQEELQVLNLVCHETESILTTASKLAQAGYAP